jgi:hypothetical protein
MIYTYKQLKNLRLTGRKIEIWSNLPPPLPSIISRVTPMVKIL